MTEASFTPGPWNVGPPEFPTKNCVYGADGVLVAKVCRNMGNDPENAALIAAAPRMLVALEELEGFLVRNADALEWASRARGVVADAIKDAKGGK
jgi:hypothetical protein